MSEAMTRIEPCDWYYDFECLLKSFDEQKNTFTAELSDGSKIELDLWTGAATKYKKYRSQKNLVGKRVFISHAWKFYPLWLTASQIEVIKGASK